MTGNIVIVIILSVIPIIIILTWIFLHHWRIHLAQRTKEAKVRRQERQEQSDDRLAILAGGQQFELQDSRVVRVKQAKDKRTVAVANKDEWEGTQVKVQAQGKKEQEKKRDESKGRAQELQQKNNDNPQDEWADAGGQGNNGEWKPSEAGNDEWEQAAPPTGDDAKPPSRTGSNDEWNASGQGGSAGNDEGNQNDEWNKSAPASYAGESQANDGKPASNPGNWTPSDPQSGPSGNGNSRWENSAAGSVKRGRQGSLRIEPPSESPPHSWNDNGAPQHTSSVRSYRRDGRPQKWANQRPRDSSRKGTQHHHGRHTSPSRRPRESDRYDPFSNQAPSAPPGSPQQQTGQKGKSRTPAAPSPPSGWTLALEKLAQWENRNETLSPINSPVKHAGESSQRMPGGLPDEGW